MKNQIFGIFFYLLYLLAMVRPVMPIIEYHANYDYISSVLCENRDKPYLECNGKCYLEKQLKKTNHHTHEHNSTVPQISFEDYPISPINQYSYHLKEFIEFNVEAKTIIKDSRQSFQLTLLKPPQIISYI